MRLSTHGASLFTIVRLIAAFAWLTPSCCLYLSQNDHRTRERRHGDRGNSTTQQSSPLRGFVNRGSTFLDTENFHFPHFKEICMILFPFHTDAPCEPHSSGHEKERPRARGCFMQWSLPEQFREMLLALEMGQGLTAAILINAERHIQH